MDLGAFSISLAVKDLAASRAFYEKLGFKRSRRPAKDWLILKNGDHVIGLFQGMFERNILTFNPGWDQRAQPLDGFTDVRELQRRLQGAGVPFASEADESHARAGQLHRSSIPTATRSSSTSTAEIVVSGDSLACGRGGLHNRDNEPAPLPVPSHRASRAAAKCRGCATGQPPTPVSGR